ncbi:mechanosensitive ion channel family protein [Dyadobacter pollutisoli]|uniref:Mechanosensitive ion channel family protein n=1 Tax=Dyadobacter pollutisoli TaxID=2910158 RepID=A0A9E8NGM5_9BACT|nr:mechanosensitive ion channel family protein [Dyadobacter pollutisoli]WAC14953.1 mechanosensitive ion channel family protein [Dyadobacter pollutisoli]
MNNTFNTLFLGNTPISWLIAIALLACLFIFIRFFKSIVIRKAKAWSVKTTTTWDDYIIEMIEGAVVPLLYVDGVYFALTTLSLPAKVENIAHIVFLMAVTFFALKIISSAFRKFVFSFIQAQENSEAKEKQASGLILMVNIVIWLFGIIFMIDNLGYNVTSLIAGLGIGGIAIALAAQTILGDLFSYFVIFFDRPFEIGDFIVIDDKSGVVEYIGIKTTRIRTLGGEQLVCSNTDLTDSRLHNYKRLQKRRIVFNLGVTYQTSHEQLSQIPGILRGIIQSKPYITFDRAHFSGYGDFSLNFEIVYYVMDADYTFYMDQQQAIYLDIFRAFEESGIDFAYPTQTLIMQLENAHIK